MNIFKAIFRVELKRLFCKRNSIILLILFLILVGVIFDGASEYENTLKNQKTFQETERTKVKQYRLITQYGAYGIRLMFIPSPASILFNNSGLFRELYSNVDVGERLNIYYSFKGNRVFPENGGLMDFSGILLLCASFIGLLYGFDGLRHRDYLTFLTTITNSKVPLYSIIVSRIILLNLALLLLASLSNLVLLVVNGINLFSWYFLCLILVLWLVSTFFTVIGSITGMFKKKVVGFFVMLAVFFIFIFFLPWTVNKVARINAGSLIPNYEVELEKLKTIMEFEDKVYKEIGIYKSGKKASDRTKKLYQSYIDNEYKRILEIEETAKKGVIKKIDFYQFISALIPTPFYFSVGYELSSRGYSDFIYFYTHNQKIKDGFFKFYIFRKFDAPISEVESYIKGDENLFYAESRLPAYLGLGIFMNILYIAILFFIARFMFKRVLHPKAVKSDSFDTIDTNLKKGQYHYFDIHDPDFSTHLLNIFSGKIKGIKGKLCIEWTSMVTPEKKDVTWLINASLVPGSIPVNELINLFKNALHLTDAEMEAFSPWLSEKTLLYEELKMERQSKLLLTAARLKLKKSETPILILDDFFTGMPVEVRAEFQGIFEQLKQENVVIIELAPKHNLYIVPDYQSSVRLETGKLMERDLNGNPRQASKASKEEI